MERGATSEELLRIRKTPQVIGEAVFFYSLLHTCVPNVAQVIGSGQKQSLEFSSSLRAVTTGLTGPTKDSTQSAIERGFGEIVKQVIAGRMHLIRYGRGRKVGDWLTSVQVDADDRDV